MDSVIVNRTEIIRGSKDEIQSLKEAFLNGQNVKESSRNLYSRTLKQFFLWVGRTQKALSELTRVDILEYKGYLENELKLSPLSVCSYITALRKFYEWTEANKIYPNIGKGLHAPKRKQAFRKQPLTVAQVGELLQYEQGTQSVRDYAIINLMVRTGLRCIEVVRANVGDVTKTGELMRDDDEVVYGDSGYTGAEKRPEIADDAKKSRVTFRISRRKGTVKAKWDKAIETRKSRVRCKVEHPFLIVKRYFGYCKLAYRGLKKNGSRLFALFASANILMCARAGRLGRCHA